MNKSSLPLSSFLFSCFVFLTIHAIAQTPEQATKITASYNTSYLQNLATKSLEKSTQEKKEAIDYAEARNIPISYVTEEGAFVALQRVMPDGTLIYYTTNNVDAAKSTRVDHLNIGGSTGYDLEGQNMTAHVWDAGHPMLTHQEYGGAGGNNRVAIMDSPTGLHYHAAHVIGTIAASGVDPNAKGMAPRSSVNSYDWNDDLSEATTAAANGMLLSNHSYGYKAEDLPSYYFGAYLWEAQDWDNLMFNAPYYLMVKAAGNDGEVTYLNSQPLLSGYDMLSSSATAKNNLVVAAANDANVDSIGNLISVNIAGFSSPGPTNDLRIKPDIAGNGVGVYSTIESSDVAYASLSGTSMASPNVTGSLLLLQEHYSNLNSTFMRVATLKGLALHTADDAGPVGPDVIWGWGLLNAKRAAEAITQNGTEALIQEMVLTQGDTITLQMESDGVNELIASISWTDIPGVVNTQLNSPTPTLVNDLDIRVSKDTITYHPWRLTSATTNSSDGDNYVDPFERIEVENASGTYTITISHKGTLEGGNQAFSLIATGVQIECEVAAAPQDVTMNAIDFTTATVSWIPIPGKLYDLRYREVGSSVWTLVSDIQSGNYEITGLEELVEYEVEVRNKCREGEPSDYSDTVVFTTLGLEYCDSYSLNASDDFYIGNVKLNTIENDSDHSAYSDFTDIGTELYGGETYTISITTEADDPDATTNYAVWIDYNRNGVFEQGERVFADITSAGQVATGSFTVPSNVEVLSTTMRVSVKGEEGVLDPCDTFDFGEVEDYAIHLMLACDRPTDVAATHVSMTFADFVWNQGNEEAGWNLSWGKPGYTPDGVNEMGNDTTNVKSYQITGLKTNTSYDFYVQADCNADGVSSWVGPYSFRTLEYPLNTLVTTWRTDNSGDSNSTSITIPTFLGETYDYDVSWNTDGVWETGFTGDATHDYGEAGTYTVAIRGNFPQIYFNNEGDKEKLLSIERWGKNIWSSMENAFYGCVNLVCNATNTPRLSQVVSMANMFRGASSFDHDIGHWDVSNISDMSFMLEGVTLSVDNYDGLLNGWNSQNLQSNVSFHAGSSKYCHGEAARVTMVDTLGWTIVDDGLDCTLDVKDNQLSEVVVFPNPVKDFLYIIGVENDTELTVINHLGQRVLRTPAVNMVDLSSLATGVYYLKLSNKTSTKFKRIIKK